MDRLEQIITVDQLDPAVVVQRYVELGWREFSDARRGEPVISGRP